MYEIDFLKVGDGERSGDAIAMRFTRPDNGELAHVIVDGGFQDDGDALVEHVMTFYDPPTVDLVISTHPDGDHIGGLGTVLRELPVQNLAIHDLAARGGSSLRAADAVKDLIGVAEDHGVAWFEPFAGDSLFGDALYVAGPSVHYYEGLVVAQVLAEVTATMSKSSSRSTLATALAQIGTRFVTELPIEVPFGDAGGTSPRNNSAVILDLRLDGERFLLTSDAGVPALTRALDQLEVAGRNDIPPDSFQVPHHGSRHNLDTATLSRLFGSPGQPEQRSAIVSATRAAPKHPSPRVVNSLIRRGCRVVTTEDMSVCVAHDNPVRPGWVPAPALPPMDESLESDD